MLMHEVGDAVFWSDTDNQIDSTDAVSGVVEAAEVVGRKFFGYLIRTT
ncbi:MAG: hypothetical protein JRF08_02155 [Deltaproteobacteria bacterium]|nr:hypothetical protein [Deltaproteobacteria bacterium]MBW2104516.1 hypothetical protein [Deltaproteobacteria bacterium]MBW2332286.1 hypothetical protein [Deltaproteobacteria bacterium]